MIRIKAEFWNASWKHGGLALCQSMVEVFAELTVTRETCFIGTPYKELPFDFCDNPILSQMLLGSNLSIRRIVAVKPSRFAVRDSGAT